MSSFGKVGTISANGEREIGELIAKAMERVGKEGVITIAVSIAILLLITDMHIIVGLSYLENRLSSVILGIIVHIFF